MHAFCFDDRVRLVHGLDEGRFEESTLADAEQIHDLVDLIRQPRMNLGADVLDRQFAAHHRDAAIQDRIREISIAGLVDQAQRVFGDEGIQRGTHFPFLHVLEH
ncbi:hypothetical protein PRO82_001110 [Candidatus Protochlamydia amoebophila]|nr:hypothetical protein [Candidatus Protochlamydia amoebophila]